MMDLRIAFSTILTVLVVILFIFALTALKSHKKIGKYVSHLCLALTLPMIGNLIIIGSSVKERSIGGYYVYFLGMDVAMAALVRFTDRYCQGIGNGKQKPTVVYFALAADFVQMLLNPFFHHAFTVEKTIVQDQPYYLLVPHWGQAIHRIVDYTAVLGVIMIFILASVKTAKIYRERYTTVLFAILVVLGWQTFYIFSRTPIDRSMIGFGVFGIIVFYLSIYYRPLRLLDRMLSDIAADMKEAIYVFDPTNKCIWANEQGLKLTGVKDTELDRVLDRLSDIFAKPVVMNSDFAEKIVVGYGDDAEYYTVESHSVKADSKRIAGSFLVVHDNTEEQKRIKRELYNSIHDSLTGLYTKQYMYECIGQMLEKNLDICYVAIFVDVKNFKIVNDVFSSAFGDIALRQVSDWIRSHMTNKCVYGRLAGDTFGVFMPAIDFHDSVVENELANFIITDGTYEHHLLIHLGIYEVVDRNIDVSVMFDRAHLALSAINDQYKTHIAYYDNKLREKVMWDQKISAMLAEAIGQMQIRPYLQPITDTSGNVVGAEALARWIHPEQGFMSPGMFIPVFEKNGMIVEVDRHIWRCACSLLAKWKGVHDELFISVNISPKDFYFFDVAEELKALVKEYDIEPEKLRIEITETVMMTELDDRMKTLDELRRVGFIVEMDDFGSGYSSLNMLKDMPVDVLKLDMRFLSKSSDEKRAQTIIRNIIHLSEELSIDSLTEGVETQEQYESLSEMGCKLFQGYYFAKPMPVEDFIEFVNKRKKNKK